MGCSRELPIGAKDIGLWKVSETAMNQQQKEHIVRMRTQGMGYRKISGYLCLSENTVKAFCRRNNLQGVASAPAAGQPAVPVSCGICRECAATFELRKGVKPKKFCSDTCRWAWWNKRPELIQRKALYPLICAHCGKAFESYGNPYRKFCCHPCYILHRFPKPVPGGDGLIQAANTRS